MNVFKEKNLNFTKRNQLSLGLIDSNGLYTNLALLLSDQSTITVKLAEYDNNLNFKIKKEFKGCLIKIFIELEEQVNRLNDVSAVIDGKSFVRKERLSYPGAALRGTILNAFCHANYLIKSNIKIEFYPSHVKITSPGGIYLASMEEIMLGVQTYRNPKLVRILDKLNFIENYGTGILRTKNSYNEYSKKLKYFSTNNFFIVTLPNVNYKENVDNINDQIKVVDQINDNINDQIKVVDQINDNIKDISFEILLIIKDNPGINVPKILLLLEKKVITNLTTIQNQIRRKLSNKVVYIGSRKTGGYYYKDEVK